MLQEAQPQLPGMEDPGPPPPERAPCPDCGRDVLTLHVDARHHCAVDVAEVLERFPCPLCAQVAGRGHERSDCERCGRSGWIGEAMPLRGVAVDADGVAREFRGVRVPGEAVHRFHVCGSHPDG